MKYSGEARGYVEMAILAIRYVLEHYKCFLPDDFTEIVTESATPEADIKSFKESISFERLISHAKVDNLKVTLAFSATSNVHDQWRLENLSHLSDPTFFTRRYMMLPLRFIGFNDVLSHYEPYVEPILSLLELAPDVEQFHKAYLEHQRAFLMEYGIYTPDGFKDYLSMARGIVVDPSIALWLRSDRRFVDQVVAQLLVHNHDLFLME